METGLPELIAVDNAATRKAARELISDYLGWIGHNAAQRYGLSFDVDAMVSSDLATHSHFWPPLGRLYVVRVGTSYVGVGGLRPFAPGVAQIERMYVRPEVRGIGAGRRVLERLIADARSIGYNVVRLESLRFLDVAHALYRSAGFKEIAPYADNSMSGYQPINGLETYMASVLFMELRLDSPR